MALLLETIRNTYMATSKHGRRLFLSNADALGGFTGVINPIEDVTSTAGTSITPFGHTNILTSGSSQLGVHTIQAISQPGVRKTIGLISTSTGNQIIKPTNAVIYTCSGATGSTAINLKGFGATIELLAISTGVWQQLSVPSSAQALVTFTTST
tara:strand:- start:26689 stop:27150 length:462 start_codon:yes stop_codon:yes gene_type:complete